ncbi:carboxylesterase/lipase family protein [Amycolatopsis umgeniensis]|uniref:Carboxylic ester hydrolase n=1 Tax=Amycolatopsis umgeniensis TaxID=336628 RepID=A0A841AYY8_9PSEU|nr:carboxylesterase family protein [Amycolatopsis umgeniensis]MBB5851760.1 para-nitrobenzyl esterase [Amycolatopsis umgeniensis]
MSKRLLTLALSMLTFGALTTAVAEAGGNPVVRTDSGPVRGVSTGGYRSFQGIPFAAPPVGALRWAPPARPEPWTAVRDASKPGPRCSQGAGIGSAPSDNEDCLYLNVVSPAGPAHKPRPVMVWVHGGGFTSGAGSDYDFKRTALGGDVVVVTVNYRLGVFGFFGHPELGRDSGSFGLQDQQAALRWVQRNARAFGGDPRNVTLFGESAGAMSTCAQLASPSAAGLFHRAILQSGPCTLTWPDGGFFPGVPAGSPYLPRAEAEAVGADVAKNLGCADVACLRRIPAKDLLSQPPGAPAFGTDLLPEHPVAALKTGRFARVPVLTGVTRNESRLLVALYPGQPFTEEHYQELLRTAFKDKAPLVAAEYPSAEHGGPAMAFADAMTDRSWGCPQTGTERLLRERTRTFSYEFADQDAPPLVPMPPGMRAGASHGSELAYLSDMTPSPGKLTSAQQKLAAQMIRYWTRFARSGNPNTGELPKWRPTPETQSLAPGEIGPVDLATVHNCGFWAGL